MLEDFPDQEQRSAVCFDALRQERGGSAPEDRTAGIRRAGAFHRHVANRARDQAEPVKIEVRNLDSGEPEVLLYDEIGDWGITAKGFAEQLQALGQPRRINLRINSPGGSVFDAAAIHNQLKRHAADVHVTVDGIALSAASTIAMAGDRIEMADNALMMIHNPWSCVIGDFDEMEASAALLRKIRDTLVTTYQSRVDLSIEKLQEMMTAETWLDAKEAVALGFADDTVAVAEVSASWKPDWSEWLDQFKAMPVQAKAELKALIPQVRPRRVEINLDSLDGPHEPLHLTIPTEEKPHVAEAEAMENERRLTLLRAKRLNRAALAP